MNKVMSYEEFYVKHEIEAMNELLMEGIHPDDLVDKIDEKVILLYKLSGLIYNKSKEGTSNVV